MAYSTIALAALAAAGAPQWVPLNSPQAKQEQGQIATTTRANAEAEAAPAPRAARFLPGGTLVSLSPFQEINSKHMREGQRFDFMVVEDVVKNGVMVIPRGSRAVGLVTAQTGRAVGGKSGKFDISFESVTANNVRFPLTGVTRRRQWQYRRRIVRPDLHQRPLGDFAARPGRDRDDERSDGLLS